jgi:cysteinyl-tRNA synthetase
MSTFEDVLDNDFNTPKALAHIHSFIAEYEPSLYSLSSKHARALFVHIIQLLELLGFSQFPSLSYRLPFRIGRLAKKRDHARSNQQFTHSDTLREKIEGLGYKVEDTPLGTFLYKKF